MVQPNAIPSITLKGMDLSNIPHVKIEETPGKRSYGRRFQVVLNGQASQEMVLKKILKQIHKISKVDVDLPREETLAKLKAGQTLLGKLKTANTDANINYENRGCWYKFRTWFHRLGNRGTHEENIAKLEAKLTQNITQLEQEIAAEQLINANPPVALTSKPINTFLEDSLNVFLIAKERQRDQSTIDGYQVITTSNTLKTLSTITLKNDKNELKITFRNGQISEILSIKPQNQTLDSIPEKFVPVLKNAYEAAITKGSTYSALSANVLQSSMKEFPVWHLNKLAEVLLKPNLESQSHSGYRYSINFIDDNLNRQRGTDAGGLRRAYISTLAECIQDQKSLFSDCKHGLKCPRIEGSKQDILSYCTQNEELAYYNLGMLLRINYNSDDITTGVYFSDVLFNAAFSFDYSELHTNFVELTRETHIRLARAIVQGLPKDDPDAIANMLTALDLCDRAKLEQCLAQTDEKKVLKELSTAALVGVDDDGMEPYLDERLINANLEVIKGNKEAFIDQLYASIFTSTIFIDELKGTSLGQVLSPIHNVARGMAVNDVARWNQIKTNGPKAFSLSAQGELDRQAIHDALDMGHYRNIQTQFNWLKEWVLDVTTTNEDLSNFLKFVSGASSLPKGRLISIRQGYGILPIGHTCSYSIDLHQSANKDQFIERLKEAIVTPDFAIS